MTRRLSSIICGICAFWLLTINVAWAEGVVAGPGAKISWNPVQATDLKEYRVFLKSISTQAYDYTKPFAVVAAPGVNQPFSGTLQPPEGQCYIVVRAVDLAGNQSGDSNQVAFVFDKTNPDAPVIQLILQ